MKKNSLIKRAALKKPSHYRCAPLRGCFNQTSKRCKRETFKEQVTACNKTKSSCSCWAFLVLAAWRGSSCTLLEKTKQKKKQMDNNTVCIVQCMSVQCKKLLLHPTIKEIGPQLFWELSLFLWNLLLDKKWATIRIEVIWLMITYYCHGNYSPILEKRPLLWCIRHQSSSLSKIDLSSVVPPHLWVSCVEEK